MLKVGLTGGIGTGKSTVAGIFASLKVPVFNADEVSRSLTETSPEIVRGIKELFGEHIYRDGKLDRKTVAGIVFNDPARLKKLNSIIHPAVHREFASWASDRALQPYVVEEAALLLESGAAKFFDHIVLVTAPLELRIERVRSRDNASREEVMSRISSQMPEEEKIPMAGYLLFNDEKTMLLPQVLAFHEKMISLSNK